MSMRASVAAHEITPTDSPGLVGYPGVKRATTAIHDPLLVSAIHLRGGGGGLILLSLDLYGFDPSAARLIRQRVCEATGSKERTIFIAPTWNHSGPSANTQPHLLNDHSYNPPDPKYLDTVVEKSVLAASEAAVASRPVTVALITLDVPGSGALLVRAANGRIIGVLLAYPDIPDHLSAANTEVSSDFIHFLRQKLATRLGGNPVVAYFAAASGDRILAGSPEEGRRTAAETGEDLANIIIDKVKALKNSDFLTDIKMGGWLTELYELPLRPIPTLAEAGILLGAALKTKAAALQPGSSASPADRKRVIKEFTEVQHLFNLASGLQKGTLKPLLDDYEPLRLHVVQMGPIRLLGLPGSITTEAAGRIAKAAGADPANTWFASGVNGDMQGSILIADESHPDAFQLLSPTFDGAAGAVIARAATNLLRESTGQPRLA